MTRNDLLRIGFGILLLLVLTLFGQDAFAQAKVEGFITARSGPGLLSTVEHQQGTQPCHEDVSVEDCQL